MSASMIRTEFPCEACGAAITDTFLASQGICDACLYKMEEQRWTKAAGPYHDLCGESLLKLAINRLAHGDVKNTRFGIRVALRPDLGDDRSASMSEAYWPDNEGCRCWSMKSRGECSHALAASIFKLEVER